MKTGPLAYDQITFNSFMIAPGFPKAPGPQNGCCHNADRGCWGHLKPQATCRIKLPKVNRPAEICITLAPAAPTLASGAVQLIGLKSGTQVPSSGCWESKCCPIPLIFSPLSWQPFLLIKTKLKRVNKMYFRHPLLHNKPTPNRVA